MACGAGSTLEKLTTVPTTPAPNETNSASTPPETAAATGGLSGSNTTGSDENESSPSDSSVTVTLPVSCSADPDIVRVRMLDLINSARAQARNCGADAFAATEPLSWNNQLLDTATEHSQDMSTHNFFSHTGSDGSNVGDRATASGYNWQRIGENIAAGQESAKAAVDGWLQSPGHCRNLMSPDFKEVSVACVENSGSDFKRYWTNVLGTQF